jgi:hypothetical protein
LKQHVLIHSDGESHTVTTAGGEAVHGIRKVFVTLEYGKPPKAFLEVLATFTGPAEATFAVRDPTSGLLKEVDRIEFTDGTAFPPHD